jgi:hypothetical protein
LLDIKIKHIIKKGKKEKNLCSGLNSKHILIKSLASAGVDGNISGILYKLTRENQ